MLELSFGSLLSSCCCGGLGECLVASWLLVCLVAQREVDASGHGDSGRVAPTSSLCNKSDDGLLAFLKPRSGVA